MRAVATDKVVRRLTKDDILERTAPLFAAALESDVLVRELRPVRVSLEEAIFDDLSSRPGDQL